MISAPAPVMALVERIITDLDAETSGDREIAQFRLENADAQQMALLLQLVRFNFYALRAPLLAGDPNPNPNPDP